MTGEKMLSPDSVPRLPRGVRIRYDKTREEWILLGPERVLKLDAIALEILKRCDGSATVKIIIEDLGKAFEADYSVIAKDVKAFLLDLKARSMVEIK